MNMCMFVCTYVCVGDVILCEDPISPLPTHLLVMNCPSRSLFLIHSARASLFSLAAFSSESLVITLRLWNQKVGTGT